MRRALIIGGAILAAAAVGFVSMRPRPLAVEVAQAARQTVREYIAEDAVTRLPEEYIVDAPLSGTVERIELEVGDRVEAGECIVRMDSFGLKQQIASLEALIAQARAYASGVDVQKPKPEDLGAAETRARQAADNEAIARRERSIAQIDFENAKREFERVEALHRQGALSQSRFDEADRVYRQAREALERATAAEQAASKAREIAELSAKSLSASVGDVEYLRDVYGAETTSREAQLEALKKDLEKTVVESPISGVVLEKYVENTRVVAAGTPLLKLGDLSAVEIECDVLSEEVGRIEVGDPVEISGKALLGNVRMGRVARVYPSGFKKISALGIEQQRVRTIVEFDNTGLNLRPGTSVDLRIITEERPNVIAVPERAAFRHENGWAVFTVESGRARLTPIEIGIKNNEVAEVRSGLEEGRIVVAEPKNDLADGVRVTAL